MRTHNTNKQYGFTLIEVMIVVAILAILAAIAYPSYEEHIRRSNRVEGRTALLDAAALLERAYAQDGRYPNAQPTFIPKKSEKGRYNIEYTSAAALQYSLRANPVFNDADCGSLTLDERGVRGFTGTKNLNFCWGR